MTTPSGSWSGTRRSFPTRTRRRILHRDPTCKIAIDGICTEVSTIADHIIGVEDALAADWALPDIHDEANGQGVCSPCHRVKTAAEQQRGRQRATQQQQRSKRATEQHPGLLTADDT